MAEQEELDVADEYAGKRVLGIQIGILPPQFRFLYVPNQPLLYQLGMPLDFFWQPHPLFTAEWGASFHFNVNQPRIAPSDEIYWGDLSLYSGLRISLIKQGIAVPYFAGRAGMAFALHQPSLGGIRSDFLAEHQFTFGVEFRTQQRVGYPIAQLEIGFLGQLPLSADANEPFTSQPRFGFQASIKIPTPAVVRFLSCFYDACHHPLK